METSGHSLHSRPQSPSLISPSPLRQMHPPAAQTNGHSTNGHALALFNAGSSNGHVVPVPGAKMYDDEPSPDRAEFVRLALQALRDCGYSDSAATLERESGYSLEVAPIADFSAAVLGGRWEESLHYLEEIGISRTVSDELSVRFRLAEQEYLELLEVSQTKRALAVLRTKLATLNFHAERVHELSSYMLCLSHEELMQRAKWDGAAGTSRQQLLNAIIAMIPADLMVRPRRLATLFSQALQHQQRSSLYYLHPSSHSESLLSDCSDDRLQFPLTVAARLEEHSDEVWSIAWSPSGALLASAGLDRKICIWRIEPRVEGESLHPTLLAIETGHTERINGIAWAPDSSVLASFAENVIKLWQAPGWKCVKTISTLEKSVCALQWLPNGSEFWSTDEGGLVHRFSPIGEELDTKASLHPLHLLEFEFTPDGRRLVGIATSGRAALKVNSRVSDESDRGMGTGVGYEASSYRLVVMDVETMTLVDGQGTYVEGVVTDCKLSRDGQTVLIFRNPNDAQLWSLAGTAPRLVRHFNGHVQESFLIRGCFGGPVDNYVLSGSEDSHVYVWHRMTGELLEVLSGHVHGAVNSISWRPDVGDKRAVFASCGDDGLVIIWDPVGLKPVPPRLGL